MFRVEVNFDGNRCAVCGETIEALKDNIAATALLWDRCGGNCAEVIAHSPDYKSIMGLCHKINEVMQTPLLRTPVNERAKTILESINFEELQPTSEIPPSAEPEKE